GLAVGDRGVAQQDVAGELEAALLQHEPRQRVAHERELGALLGQLVAQALVVLGVQAAVGDDEQAFGALELLRELLDDQAVDEIRHGQSPPRRSGRPVPSWWTPRSCGRTRP